MGNTVNNKHTIMVCEGTGCVSSKSPQIYAALKNSLEELGLEEDTEIKFTGCHGFCQQGPIVVVEPEHIFYTHVREDDAAEIVQSHIAEGQPVERLFYRDPSSDKLIPHYPQIDFYNKQKRIILKNCGHINPENIHDYIHKGGYQALEKVLREMTPEEVIEEVKESNLRGRGGAGFPTGIKWEFCRRASGSKKYLVCNADEGDPGAFMDRSILEADPHKVLEGMVIAAYAIGAEQGYIYVRAEYPLALKRFRKAIGDAQEQGFLGKNILGSGTKFHLEISEGAGAFVCGEETAMMSSIQGKRGMPSSRPPYPANSGLWGKPTNINNVKTFASIPAIISQGGEWFAGLGSESSGGTMVFALTGKIANSGLVEVPIGTTLREIIFDIGGGIPNGKKFKAVQTGGPSGGCIPADLLDLPIDYESLQGAGSIMGSGGMVVMDQDTCMVDVARYFLSFVQEESCGKCTPCRVGTKRMLEILNKITQGKGEESDLELLEEIAQMVKESSLCGLGQTAPNPVLTTIRYFRDEYLTHIEDKKCPAGVCVDLVTYRIIEDNCRGCNQCKDVCPSQAIEGEPGEVYVIDPELCEGCGLCAEVCKFGAVKRV